MKKIESAYEEPQLLVTTLVEADVITTSGNTPDNFLDEDNIAALD